MIKVYKIKIGEKVYEVEVEAVSEKEGKIEVSKKANSQGVPIVYQKLTGLSNLQECFKNLAQTHNSKK